MAHEFKNYTEEVERFVNRYRGSWYETAPNMVQSIARALRISTLNTGNDDLRTCEMVVEAIWYGR